MTGKVGKLTVVELEREVGSDLKPERETEVERRGAVIDRLRRFPRAAVMAA